MKVDISRKTNTLYFIPEIDGLRFFAIITVVIFHLNTSFSKSLGIGLEESLSRLGGVESMKQLGWWVVRLDLGVKVFFSISGFILALPFVRYFVGKTDKSVDWKSYYLRRLTRLEPPFVVSLLIFFIIHVLFLGEDFSIWKYHFLAGLVYGHGLIFGSANPINPVTWSLETEAQFYLLVPLIFLLLSRIKSVFWIMVSIILLIIASFWFKHLFIWDTRWANTIFAYFGNFGVGILFCYIYVIRSSYFERKNIVFDLLGLLSSWLLFCFYKPQGEWLSMVLFNVAIFLFFVSVFKGNWFNRWFTTPWVYQIGGMCYSVYLLHYAFLHGSMQITSKLNLTNLSYSLNLGIQLLIGIPLILLVSGVFYILVERPCMDKEWPMKLRSFLSKRFGRAAKR